ncbi:MAG: nucleotidyltransferase domain-containing protein [Bacteroidales bacterium]|jgi:predicted nucleotidyltransferase|nr:nucleotidyltransferase domain-containing protein [Bacteroidales bacterium]
MDSIKSLQERAKELQCIYDIEQILSDRTSTIDNHLYKILKIIPHGWQFPNKCHAKIEYNGKTYALDTVAVTKWNQISEIVVDDNIVGKITVFYADLPFQSDCFLPEEQKLLNTIADRLSHYIFSYQLTKTIEHMHTTTPADDSMDILKNTSDEYWQWRLRMAEKIAEKTNYDLLGVKAMYIIGSTKEATAGPASDIDLLVHFTGNNQQKENLKAWIEGWSFALEEVNKQKTGYGMDHGIIDLHIITDEDIEKQTSYGVMVDSVHHTARLLK